MINDYMTKHPSYALIDPILSKWGGKNSFHIYKYYREDEIRSFKTDGTKWNGFNIWVDAPVDDEVGVHVSDSGRKCQRRSKDWNVKISELEPILEEALNTFKSWMN